MFKTHIIHCKNLIDRKTHIENQLRLQNIKDYDLIVDFDADQLTSEIIDQYYIDNKDICDEDSKITLAHNRCAESVYKTLSLASISLCIKHIESLRRFLADNKYEYLLVLEDDCSFVSSSVNIDNIIMNAPNNWDILFIGGAFGYNILPIKSVINGYVLSGHPSTNTTSSMIYNRKSAQQTLETMVPFSLPIDWHLNHVFHINNFIVYHTNPYICNQLSGTYFNGTVERC